MFTLKTLKTGIAACILFLCSGIYAQTNSTIQTQAETPANTIFIKHPAANDPAVFFATGTVFSFEIYKPSDIAKIIHTLQKYNGVENILSGKITGSYHQISLTLKSSKNKTWFSAFFRSAGLNTIKINNNPIVEVSTL